MAGGWMPLPTHPQRYCDPVSLVLLVYANNNHKKKYKEKVLSLTKIDFKNSMPRRSFSKVAKSSLTSILSVIKPYFEPQMTYLLFI